MEQHLLVDSYLMLVLDTHLSLACCIPESRKNQTYETLVGSLDVLLVILAIYNSDPAPFQDQKTPDNLLIFVLNRGRFLHHYASKILQKVSLTVKTGPMTVWVSGRQAPANDRIKLQCLPESLEAPSFFQAFH